MLNTRICKYFRNGKPNFKIGFTNQFFRPKRTTSEFQKFAYFHKANMLLSLRHTWIFNTENLTIRTNVSSSRERQFNFQAGESSVENSPCKSRGSKVFEIKWIIIFTTKIIFTQYGKLVICECLTVFHFKILHMCIKKQKKKQQRMTKNTGSICIIKFVRSNTKLLLLWVLFTNYKL